MYGRGSTAAIFRPSGAAMKSDGQPCGLGTSMQDITGDGDDTLGQGRFAGKTNPHRTGIPTYQDQARRGSFNRHCVLPHKTDCGQEATASRGAAEIPANKG